MSNPDNFLARWSRRKREVANEPAAASPRQDTAQQPSVAPTKEASLPAHESEPAFDLSKLPSLDSIGPGTDIRMFLQAGVPAALSRAALRRAWTADPQISTFVGLSENAWDFTAPGSMPGFGALDPGEAQRIFAQLMGDRDPEKPNDAAVQDVCADGAESDPEKGTVLLDAERATGTADNASQQQPIGLEAELLQSSTSASGPDAVSETHNESLDQLPRRRSHGGALPN